MVQGDYLNEAKLDFKCKECNKHTTIPVLRVEAGIKCKHCGAEFPFDCRVLAMQMPLLFFAFGRKDTKID